MYFFPSIWLEILCGKWNSAAQNFLGDHWEPILKKQKSTCHLNKPFDIGRHANVISAYRADHLDACLLHGTTISANNTDSKFLFWSPTEIPFSREICGNCFIFRNCDEQYRTAIKLTGNTYQHTTNKYIPTIAKENGMYTSWNEIFSRYSYGIISFICLRKCLTFEIII